MNTNVTPPPRAFVLTPAGRRWAERNSLTSMCANVALHGYSTGWPENFVTAAIQTANEEGTKR